MLLKRKYLFGTTILAGVMAVTAPAFAQEQQLPGVNVQGQTAEEATEVEAVVVTGSRIRRDPTNSPTPLIQVTGEQLLTTGQSTVIDYLATIPALSNSLVPSDTTGSNLNDGGLSFANLRSLGSGRTLVLVDGRRHVGASQGNLAVDIDSIPRLLIENIEIITGGASSVYGADAVSGVLNFNLRNDFEGIEIDGNYGMVNQDGQANKRISALAGINLLDDRLNLYAFAEYEDIDEVQSLDIDWLRNSKALVQVDRDVITPTDNTLNNDGILDRQVFENLTTLSRPRWGALTLANATRPTAANDPDIGLWNCTAITSANCYAVMPGKTYVFEGPTARLADFGTRVGVLAPDATSPNLPLNIGGDGENPSAFGQETRVPESTSERYQVGANFAIAPNVDLTAEYKLVEEDTYDIGQPVFFDIFVNDYDTSYTLNSTNRIRANSQFDLRYRDNAYLQQHVKDAIDANMVQNWTVNPTTPGSPAGPEVSRRWARHAMFGPQRDQTNHREVERFVIALSGDFEQLAFVKNIDWDLSYTYGEARNRNTERGVDIQRFALAADAVVDTNGLVNGRPGEIVCRASLLAETGGNLDDWYRGGLLTDSDEGTAALNECVPLNVFGAGNQSAEALAYVDAAITVSHTNEQEQALGIVSGQLWDFWGAGSIGVALGAEYRREFTEGVGRNTGTGDRFLFLNTGPDFAAAEYESEEWFAELSIPLMRDTWLGEFAELSGSYRQFDYTTAGDGDVYGINFIYRPVQDITFKTSFNTSFRAPNLAENFAPRTQTFQNGFVDPCNTSVILNLQDTRIRDNRRTNCALLQTQYNTLYGTNYNFDFGNTTTTADDFIPAYSGGIAGVNGGNIDLQPERSESFTFSTVLEPRWFPNLSLVLDYYEIEIKDVISSVTAQQAANNCVNGDNGLNQSACDTIFRFNPLVPFGMGAPSGDPIGGFLQGSINYAALTTRGLDFTVRYSVDTEEAFGHNWGRFDYQLGGLWLIEQETFLNSGDATDGTELSSNVFYPRVRMTSSLTYTPNDTWSVNWTMDWQTAQESAGNRLRDLVGSNDVDARPFDTLDTGNFARHDFTVRANIRDDLSVRFGVVNAFDAEQAAWLGNTLYSNFDPYGTRFFIGLNYRPF